MDQIKIDFNDRVSEIDTYLKTLELLSLDETKIYKSNSTRPTIKSIDSDSLKIMRATAILMLYNLVESTIRSSFIYIYSEINNSSCSLDEIVSELKDIWVKQQFVNMEPVSSNQESYRKLVVRMVDEVLNGTSIVLDSEKLPISGNIDAREVRNLTKMHNIENPLHYRANNGGELVTVKSQRNSLAHGNTTFTQVGNMYTAQDLIRIKKQIVTFLKSTLRNVEKYINSSAYAK